MARPSSKDPLDKFRWTIEIEGFTKLGFAQCGVPSITYNTKKYTQGGEHYFPKQIIDSVEYKPVVLQRGVTTDESFMSWARQAMELHRGRAENPTTEDADIRASNETLANLQSQFGIAQANGPLDPTSKIPLEYRREVRINHLNRSGDIVKTYVLTNAFPIEFAPASDFASDADDVLSMERLVLAYESFYIETTKKDSNPFDIRDTIKRVIRRL